MTEVPLRKLPPCIQPLSSGASLVEDGHGGCGPEGDGVGGIDRNLQDGPRNVELASVDTIQRVLNLAALLRIDLGGAVEGDDGASVLREGIESGNAIGAEATGELGRSLRRRRTAVVGCGTASLALSVGLRIVAVRIIATTTSRSLAFAKAARAGSDGARRIVREHDHVKTLIQIALANIGIHQTRVRDMVLVKDEARPTFIHGSYPTLVKTYAWQMHGQHVAAGHGRRSLDVERKVGCSLVQLRFNARLCRNIDRPRVGAGGDAVGMHLLREQREQSVEAGVRVVRDQIALGGWALKAA